MLSIFKKNTKFGRNTDSDLPLYYDNISIEGETTQETRSGKNLYNGPATNTANGITFKKNENGSYNISGTSTAQANDYNYVDLEDSGLENGKSYTFSANQTLPQGVYVLVELYNGSTWLRHMISALSSSTQQDTSTSNLTNVTRVRFGLRIENGKTINISNLKIQLELGTTATDYEQYGVQPSPNYPSNLVSVGYKNLWELPITSTFNGITYTNNEDGTFNLHGTATANAYFLSWFPLSKIKDNTYYTLSSNYLVSGLEFRFEEFLTKNGTWIKQYNILTTSYPNPRGLKVVKGNGTYVRLAIFIANGTTINKDNIKIQLEEGSIAHSYIPYGKYGIEVKTTGKNLFDKNTSIVTGKTWTSTGTETNLTNCFVQESYIPVTSNTAYTISTTNNYSSTTDFRLMICEYDTNKNFIRRNIGTVSGGVTTKYTITTGSTTHYVRLGASSVTIDELQFEKNTQATSYEPYVSNINLITMDNPLRRIRDTKDLLYIKNGMLYIERKIGSVVLDGSENWNDDAGTIGTSYRHNILLSRMGISNVDDNSIKISDHFIWSRTNNGIWGEFYLSSTWLVILDKNKSYTLAEFKEWLASNNVEVQYVLDKPTIESYELNIQPMIFESLGYGVLSDVTSDPLITEELNSSYILEFEYKKDGIFSEYLVEENIVKANGEPFSIYSIKKNLNGRINVLAKHWVLNEWDKDFILDSAPTNLNAQSALEWIQNRSINSSDISITGDCENTATARYVRKNMLDAIFNEDNAILKKFGGELSYNIDNVVVHNHRGSTTGITIRQGKNVTGAEYYLDFSTVATRIVPVGRDELMLDDIYVDSPLINNYATPIIRKVEVDTDDANELENYCNQLFDDGIDKPTVSIKIDFIELSKTTEYQNYSSLETAHLGDTVNAYIPSLNINVATRVVKVVYNDNLKRITSLELGSITPNIAISNVNMNRQITQIATNNFSMLDDAKNEASQMIKHPFGGRIYIDDNTGNMYIMDTTDINTAQCVWRWGLGGLGFSSTGVNGTYGIAMTQDGKIVADYITTGTIAASVIKSINLNLTANDITISSTNFSVTKDGTITAKNGNFSGSIDIEGDRPNYSNDDAADLYIHYHELEEDIEGFGGETGSIETTNESKMFSNGVFLQSIYNNSVPGSTGNTYGYDRVSQLNMDLYDTYNPISVSRFMRDSNSNVSGEYNSRMRYGGFSAHDASSGDFSVVGSVLTLTDISNNSLEISPDSRPKSVLSNWYSTSATTLSGAKSHKLLIILAKPSSSSAITSLIVPTDCLTTSNQQFQCADESKYVSFYIRYSGSNIIITGAGRTSDGTIVSAWTML